MLAGSSQHKLYSYSDRYNQPDLNNRIQTCRSQQLDQTTRSELNNQLNNQQGRTNYWILNTIEPYLHIEQIEVSGAEFPVSKRSLI